MSRLNPTLGDWADRIVDGAIQLEPRIGEAHFKREVLDILQNIFTPEALRRYQSYVGEVSMPLNVLDDTDGKTILFTVPALAMRPRPTMATEGGVTANNILKAMERAYDLGDLEADERVAQFMLQITGFGDYQEDVVKPIQTILARYDRTLNIPEAPKSDTVVENEDTAPTEQTGNESFTDEYED